MNKYRPAAVALAACAASVSLAACSAGVTTTSTATTAATSSSSPSGTATPAAGYTVSTNSVINQGSNTVVLIQFTGHGIKGTIGELAKDTDTTVELPGLGHKNVTTIALQSK
jgi:hypothetical protein